MVELSVEHLRGCHLAALFELFNGILEYFKLKKWSIAIFAINYSWVIEMYIDIVIDIVILFGDLLVT